MAARSLRHTEEKESCYREDEAWLGDFSADIPADIKTPYDMALFEAEEYRKKHPEGKRIFLVKRDELEEGYFFEKTPSGYQVAGGGRGVPTTAQNAMRWA